MIKVRFAPSPTGLIHLGNARPALLNYMFAKKNDGQFILRFDDTDKERSKEKYANAIKQDLSWLGIEPDLIVRQSDRFAKYDEARDKLIKMGKLYPCYETGDELDRARSRARAMGRPPIYNRAALELSQDDIKKYEGEGRKPHWRYRLDAKPVTFDDLIRGEQVVNTASMSDPVLIRGDGSYLYTLPSVVDDIDLEISHIIRGEDHVSNSGVQVEIFEALGAKAPIFAHHNLLTDVEGKGLSKRLGSLSLSSLREQGYEAIAVATMATLTGTSVAIEPLKDLDELAEKFDFSIISRGPARYDESELDSLNARILHNMSYDSAKSRLENYELEGEALWLALRENLHKFSDIKDLAKLVTGPVEPIIAPEDKEFIELAAKKLPSEPYDETSWGQWTSSLKNLSDRKGKSLFMPLRLALTGLEHGPELKLLLPLIGRKECLARLS
ncbi:MAG: glutamate--tRNA ligase [Devosiaceae bacterium]|nr:glutamate--tRNA ligase [Devosiaceae bacterium]